MLRGAGLFKGYVGVEPVKPLFDDESYFYSGDMGYLDEGGWLVVTGRIKDLIIRNGENIAAKKIEDVLHEDARLRDLAVIGLPDKRTGERVCAVVECEENTEFFFDDMIALCEESALMKHEYPEQLEIIDQIPRNVAGKVLKESLKRRFSDATKNN